MIHRFQVWAYREEFLINGDSLDGVADLEAADDFESWFLDVNNGKN